jgi:hypothetical protein
MERLTTVPGGPASGLISITLGAHPETNEHDNAPRRKPSKVKTLVLRRVAMTPYIAQTELVSKIFFAPPNR